jgi:hypothetical protein
LEPCSSPCANAVLRSVLQIIVNRLRTARGEK